MNKLSKKDLYKKAKEYGIREYNYQCISSLNKSELIKVLLLHQGVHPIEDIEKKTSLLYIHGGLNYIQNSCYQDTVLTILLSKASDHFCVPNILNFGKFKKQWIMCDDKKKFQEYKYCVDIQHELRYLKSQMHIQNNEININKLRILLKHDEYSSTNQNSAYSFLQYIFELFKINTLVKNTTIYVKDKCDKWIEYTKHENQKVCPIVHVSCFDITEESKEINISKFIKYEYITKLDSNNVLIDNDKVYNTVKTAYDIQHVDYLVFYISRKKGTKFHIKLNTILKSEKLLTPIYPEKILVINNDQNLKLIGIITHYGNHYTSYLCNQFDIWYYYNDIPKCSMKYIGSYHNMLNQKPNPCKYGVLYFYTKMLTN